MLAQIIIYAALTPEGGYPAFNENTTPGERGAVPGAGHERYSLTGIVHAHLLMLTP